MFSEPLSNTTIYTGLDNNDLIIVSRQPLAQSSYNIYPSYSVCPISSQPVKLNLYPLRSTQRKASVLKTDS